MRGRCSEPHIPVLGVHTGRTAKQRLGARGDWMRERPPVKRFRVGNAVAGEQWRCGERETRPAGTAIIRGILPVRSKEGDEEASDKSDTQNNGRVVALVIHHCKGSHFSFVK